MTADDHETSAVSSGADDNMPEEFGRYRILKRLGQGAMGTVYLAHDSQLDRQIALKIPKATVDDPRYLERFYREARAAAALRHPNICPVYDVGETDGTRYIAMAYIAGKPLSACVGPNRSMTEHQVATIVRKLALALASAHASGIVHRDLKPGNVIVDEAGEPVIMDFGLARHYNQQGLETLTQVGVIMGSPAYMAPEQIEGREDQMGPRSDIYSLGVVTYELLTGLRPFRGTVTSTITQIITKEPKRPSDLRPGLNWLLESICLKMMSRSLDQRYETMADVAAALQEFLSGGSEGDGTSSSGVVQPQMIPAPIAAARPTGPLLPDLDGFVPLKGDDDDWRTAQRIASAAGSDAADESGATEQPDRSKTSNKGSHKGSGKTDTKIRRLEQRFEEIRTLVKQREYATALRLLEKMAALDAARFAKYAKWAKAQLPEVRSRLERKRNT